MGYLLWGDVIIICHHHQIDVDYVASTELLEDSSVCSTCLDESSSDSGYFREESQEWQLASPRGDMRRFVWMQVGSFVFHYFGNLRLPVRGRTKVGRTVWEDRAGRAAWEDNSWDARMGGPKLGCLRWVDFMPPRGIQPPLSLSYARFV